MDANVDLIQTSADIPLLATRAFAALLLPTMFLPVAVLLLVVVVVVLIACTDESVLALILCCQRCCCCCCCCCFCCLLAGTTTMFVSILSKLVRFFNCCNVA